MSIIEVHLLGTFEIYVENHLVSETIARSKKLRYLVEFLILNRNRLVSSEELIAAIWGKRPSKDPRSALKILIHRLRNGLIEGGAPEAIEFLLKQQGFYRWNPDLQCIFDFEKFEALCDMTANDRSDTDAVYIRLGSACNLYHGRLMQDAMGEPWVGVLGEQLHEKFLHAADHLIGMMERRQMYADRIRLCKRVLSIDPAQEAAQEAYIFALAQSGNDQEAIRYYKHHTLPYYRKRGQQPPERLHQLYQQIVETERKTGLDIHLICEELREKERIPGAFVCAYEIFREVYRLEARSMVRYQTCAAIALLTLNQAGKPRSERTWHRIMLKLMECARLSLRCGDMLSRYSASQLVIMLPTASIEMGEAVCERIIRNFEREYPKLQVLISHSVRAIEPSDSLLPMQRARIV